MKGTVNLVILLVTMMIVSGKGSELHDITQNLIEDEALDAWKAPEEIRTNFPYYLACFDEDSKPIWMAEAGKWDVRKIVEGGGQAFKDFDMYVDQMAQRFLRSMKSGPDEPLTGAITLLDMEGYNMWQLSSVKTVAYVLKKTRQLEPVARSVELGFVINTNYVAETIINLVRPILGQIMERIEIFGSNKQKWMPRIQKRIPKSCLPEFYGGNKTFQPIHIYG